MHSAALVPSASLREPKGFLLKGGLHLFVFPLINVSSLVSPCFVQVEALFPLCIALSLLLQSTVCAAAAAVIELEALALRPPLSSDRSPLLRPLSSLLPVIIR